MSLGLIKQTENLDALCEQKGLFQNISYGIGFTEIKIYEAIEDCENWNDNFIIHEKSDHNGTWELKRLYKKITKQVEDKFK